jgi:hypothetical protein
MNSKTKGGLPADKKTVSNIRCLMPADPALSGLEGQGKVLATMPIVLELARTIEPVG